MVYSELKSFAGIYLIINLVNGKMYVGSGTVGRIPMRFHKHLFSGKGSQLVWNAVKKYGLNNFAFLILDKINNFTPKNNQKLIDLENFYIKLLAPEYNLAPQAGNTLGYKHSENTKTKMKLNYSSERREKIASLNRGQKLYLSTKNLMRQSALSRKPMSDQVRAKISANSTIAHLFKLTKVNGEPFDTSKKNLSIEIRTINAVADYWKCSEKTVRRAIFKI